MVSESLNGPLTCSIGIFAYNEEHRIGALLDSLMCQQLVTVMVQEIFMVASGCTDKTVEVVHGFMKRDKRISLLIQEEREGKASAINLFLKECSADIAVIINADLILCANTLYNLLKPFSESRIGMTGGRAISLNDKNTFMGFANHLLWDMHHEISLKYPKLGELVAYRKLPNFAFPSDTVDDEGIVESFMVKNGYCLQYVPAAVFYNKGPTCLSEFIMRRRNIFAGHLQLKRRTTYRVSTMDGKKLLAALSAQRIKSAARNPRCFFWTIAVILTEFYARLLAMYDFYILKRDHSIWQPARSAREAQYGTINYQTSTV